MRDLRNIIELLEACLTHNQPADWDELIARLCPLVHGVVATASRNCGISDLGVFEDLAQETFVKLFKDDRESLISFHSQRSSELDFFGYIKVIASHVVYDYGKSIRASKRSRSVEVYTDDPDTTAIACPSVVDLLSIDIERVFGDRAVTVRDRTIFWLYYKHGYSAQEIARMPLDLTTKGVEACLHRLTALLRGYFGTVSPDTQKRQTPHHDV